MTTEWTFDPRSDADRERVRALVESEPTDFAEVGQYLHSFTEDAATKALNATERIREDRNTQRSEPALPPVDSDRTWFYSSNVLSNVYRDLLSRFIGDDAKSRDPMTLDDAKRWVVLAWLALHPKADATLIGGPTLAWYIESRSTISELGHFDGRLLFRKFQVFLLAPADPVFTLAVTVAVRHLESARKLALPPLVRLWISYHAIAQVGPNFAMHLRQIAELQNKPGPAIHRRAPDFRTAVALSEALPSAFPAPTVAPGALRALREQARTLIANCIRGSTLLQGPAGDQMNAAMSPNAVTWAVTAATALDKLRHESEHVVLTTRIGSILQAKGADAIEAAIAEIGNHAAHVRQVSARPQLAGSADDKTKAKDGATFPFRDEHLTILVELAAFARLVKASELDGKSGMPCYDRLLDLLGELESAEPKLVTRGRGKRSGFEITPAGRGELIRRSLIDRST